MMTILMGHDENLIKAFEEVGLVPAPCRRIVIDLEFGEAVKLYYECYGDERILELDLPHRLHGATVIRARDIQQGEEQGRYIPMPPASLPAANGRSGPGIEVHDA